MRVLIIDDSEVALSTIKHVLEKAGMTVFCRTSPIGTTPQIVRDKIEAVVMDVNMPSITGTDFVQVLRSNDELKHIPIILVSSATSDEMIEEGERSGAQLVLSKKRIPQDLADAIRRLVEESRPT